ncbi:uncharacterized protein LOC133304723 [Gastrolobium bilobum]|uniref:uncharacterized protein LOC133304723 n=1 Tax=Gastrolobium bilobum TaxID=150636 RepID=UPI002AB0E386|nr:uncharacterized protein LOC133304723 [Gastrolobium bilobum]
MCMAISDKPCFKEERRKTGKQVVFDDLDDEIIDPEHDDPLVISGLLAIYRVDRMLVDSGSSVDIIFLDAFRRMDLDYDQLEPCKEKNVVEPPQQAKEGNVQREEEGKKEKEVMVVGMDPRVEDKADRPEPAGAMEEVQLGISPKQCTKMGFELEPEVAESLKDLLKKNADLFAWKPSDMPGMDPALSCHRLAMTPGVKPVAQKKRRFCLERRRAIEEKTQELLEAGFIREIEYATWLANPVLIRKPDGKWRMCTDYTDFNKIPLWKEDQEKTAFITDNAVYCYNVMPFGLKNAGATYMRMMNKVFKAQMGRMLEVYMNDMIVKSGDGKTHLQDLQEVFEQVGKHNMRLNPSKCTFGVPAGNFLGFLLTERGIKANTDKCRAVMEMKSPENIKEAQKLNGRVTALSRFLAKSAQVSLPLFQLLKKGSNFAWTEECETTFQRFKEMLASPPILGKPEPGEVLYLYLSVSQEAVSSVLVREGKDGKQQPVYFISKVLQGAETRYQHVEKIAFTLLITARRLHQYFQCHQVVVRTNQPIRQMLHKPDLAGRMVAWAVELSEFGIHFEARNTIKAQAFADFVVEMTQPEGKQENGWWKLFVDGSSNKRGSGVGVIIENPEGAVVEHSLALEFPTTNNQAEYEAMVTGLVLAKELGAELLEVYSDFQLATSQISGVYQARGEIMIKYLARVQELMKELKEIRVEHIRRNDNVREDVLSKLASTKASGNLRTIIQQNIRAPSMVWMVEEVDWRSPIIEYLEKGKEPGEKMEASRLRRRAAWFVRIEGQLYRRGINSPLLKCIAPPNTEYVLEEIHEGINGHHLGGKSLARKLYKQDIFGQQWEKMLKNMYADVNSVRSPFPRAAGGVKYLIVAADYFTKWIEAEPVTTKTARKVQKFFIRKIICRFGIPAIIITDNGTQFIDRKFRQVIADLGIKHQFAAVEHPQTNGQVDLANKILTNGLKRRVEACKGSWVEELDNVLWGYRTSVQFSIQETPFKMTYGFDTMLPVEVREPSWRRKLSSEDKEKENSELMKIDMQLLEEERDKIAIVEMASKQRAATRYNRTVVKRTFQVGDLVLRRADVGNKNARDGKLAANWEGPYRVTKATNT